MHYDEFLNNENTFAIVGVSEDKEKWGRKLYDRMKEIGFKVIPINPKYISIDGDKCYGSLKDVPDKVDVMVTVVPPFVTERYVREAVELGINKVWMQPGSELEEAIQMCEDAEIELIHNACLVVDGLETGWEG